MKIYKILILSILISLFLCSCSAINKRPDSYLSILDFTVDSYTYTQENFDEYEDNIIYYDDDSYEEIEVENGIIVEAKLYDCNDQLIFHIKCNELGYTESMKYYLDGELNYSISTKYKEVTFD